VGGGERQNNRRADEARRRGLFRGIQSGWQTGGDRVRRWDGPAVGDS
jgi:hypothetical protein